MATLCLDGSVAPIRLQKRNVAPLHTIINGKPRGKEGHKIEERQKHLPEPVNLDASPISSDDEFEHVCLGQELEPNDEDGVPLYSKSLGEALQQPTTSIRDEKRSSTLALSCSPMHDEGVRRETRKGWNSNKENVHANQKRKRRKSLDTKPYPAMITDDDFGDPFRVSSSQRSMRTYKKLTSNIHTSGTTQGSSGGTELRNSGKITGRNGFVKFPERSLEHKKPKGPSFIQPRGIPEQNLSSNKKSFKRAKSITSSSTTIDSFKIWNSDELTSSPLSSPPASIGLNDSGISCDFQSSQPLSPFVTHMSCMNAICPMCSARVDVEFLQNFCGGRKLRWKDQLAFCTAHKRLTAMEEWTSRGYPEIDWEGFDSRLEKYHARLEAILDRKAPSFYRQGLEEKVATGKNRNDLRTVDAKGEQNQLPGYYGLRGKTRMQDHIMGAFGEKIRLSATNDSLFNSVGATGFVQMVLAPELAVMLVIADYNEKGREVPEQEAREILRESAEIGGLVNAEEEEQGTRKEAMLDDLNGEFEDEDSLVLE